MLCHTKYWNRISKICFRLDVAHSGTSFNRKFVVNILKYPFQHADSFPTRGGHLKHLPDAKRLGLHSLVQHAHQPPKGKTASSAGTALI